MSGFWDRALGNQQPAARPAPPPQAPQAGPWWQPQPQPQPVQPQYPQQYEQPQDQLQGRKLPASASNGDRCPECNSGDYVAVATAFTQRGQVQTKRCFDCGYPVKQQFSGMAAITDGGAVGKAQQVAHAGGVVSNFAPQSTQAPAFAAEHGGPGRG